MVTVQLPTKELKEPRPLATKGGRGNPAPARTANHRIDQSHVQSRPGTTAFSLDGIMQRSRTAKTAGPHEAGLYCMHLVCGTGMPQAFLWHWRAAHTARAHSIACACGVLCRLLASGTVPPGPRCTAATVTVVYNDTHLHLAQFLTTTCRYPTPPNPPVRHRAAGVAMQAGEAGFALLEKSCLMARVLTNSGPGSTQADKDLGEAAMSAMTQGSVLRAAAAAARALVATAARTTRSGTTGGGASVRQGAAGVMYGMDEDDSTHCDILMATAAAGVCTYTWNVTNLLHYRLDAVRIAGQGSIPVGGSGSASTLSSIPPGVAQLVESLVESQLLAAAATVVLDCPNMLAVDSLKGELATAACGMLSDAAFWLARSVVNLNTIEGKLWTARVPGARPLAAKLLRAARHTAVVRLQVALLDQLAAHAGMGAELEGEEAGESQGEQAGAWVGSSGSWWFAREEARQGQLLGVVEQAQGQTAGWLEDRHCTILYGVFRRWCAETETQLDAEAGVPARPPPLLAARLAARAAEALCRLCRGQGLRGAYAPAPMWEFAKCQVCCLPLHLAVQ